MFELFQQAVSQLEIDPIMPKKLHYDDVYNDELIEVFATLKIPSDCYPISTPVKLKVP